MFPTRHPQGLFLIIALTTASHAAFAQGQEPAPDADAPPPATPEVAAPVAAAAPAPSATATAPATSPTSPTGAPATPPPAHAAATAPASASEPPSSVPPPPAETEMEPAGPKKLAVGKSGFLQPGVNFQGWAFLSNTDTAGGPETAFTFRVRRAQLKAKGDLIPDRVKYAIMIDPAKTLRFGTADVPVQNQDPPASDPDSPEQVTVATPPRDTSILQDLILTVVTPLGNASIGQFRAPLTLAGVTSSTKLVLPEDPLVTRTFNGRQRDGGLKIEKKFEYVGYDLGLYNGQGPNQLDADRQKNLALRLEVYPLEGLILGGVGYVGIGERDDVATKDRVQGDIRVDLANVLFQLEYLHAWDGPDGNRREGHGGNAVLGYTFAKRLQPVARLGFVDPDVDEGDSITRHYEVGLNYFVLGDEVKVQASYGLFDTDQDPDDARHEGTLAMQVSY